MRIEAVDGDKIIVRAPKAKNLQQFAKDDIETVLEIWADTKPADLNARKLRNCNHPSGLRGAFSIASSGKQSFRFFQAD